MAPSQPRIKRNSTMQKKLEDERKRLLSSSKRKPGLFNKPTELSLLCLAETALIITSKNHDGAEIIACGHPSPDAVIQRFRSGGPPLIAENKKRQEEEEEKLE